eukprot:TRINITY_DN3656_c0_g1_i1.p1 TRINITY_DN3656_c0_g1~~TRINITY_DN3656_c0_g1_i1.p1  ORF type:complete len:963 (+),score=281.49 TRINITY_DN3656_c0_g1_i1:119-2890(+)
MAAPLVDVQSRGYVSGLLTSVPSVPSLVALPDRSVQPARQGLKRRYLRRPASAGASACSSSSSSRGRSDEGTESVAGAALRAGTGVLLGCALTRSLRRRNGSAPSGVKGPGTAASRDRGLVVRANWPFGFNNNDNTRDEDSEAGKWWKQHPVRGDVLLGWLSHPRLLGGERIDLEVEFQDCGSGNWRSRKLGFFGPFRTDSSQPLQLIIKDKITVLQGEVSEAGVVTGKVQQSDEMGGFFELQAIPSTHRIWWDARKDSKAMSSAGMISAGAEGEEGDEDGKGGDDRVQLVSAGPQALFSLLTGTSLKNREAAMAAAQEKQQLMKRSKLDRIRNFSLYPQEVKQHLDRFVVRQDSAKETLAVAICDHYNRTREELQTAFEQQDADSEIDKAWAKAEAEKKRREEGSKKPKTIKPRKSKFSEQLSRVVEGKEAESHAAAGSKAAKQEEEDKQEEKGAKESENVTSEAADAVTSSKSTGEAAEAVAAVDVAEVGKVTHAVADTGSDRQDEDGKAASTSEDADDMAEAHASDEDENGKKSKNLTKPNVLLLGPTGSGKTYLLKVLADLIGVPFVKADATKFTETGYVGRDADDVLRDLLQAADGDVELAQLGIVYMDEIDKISGDSGGYRDSFRKGTQSAFLKLMEETEVVLSDGPGNMRSPFGGGGEGPKLSTRNILFVFSGAFSELDKRLREEHEKESKGFGFFSGLPAEDDDNVDAEAPAESSEATAAASSEGSMSLSSAGGSSSSSATPGGPQPKSFLYKAKTEDLIKAGLEAEFVGRMPVRVALGALTEDDLYAILTKAEDGAASQLVSDFKRYGIELRLTEDSLRAFARKAAQEGTGARALVTVLEDTLRRFKFHLPSLVPRGLKVLDVTPELVAKPEDALTALVERYQDAPLDAAALAAVAEATAAADVANASKAKVPL